MAAIHSIAQELVMLKGMTLERAEERVSEMQELVQMEAHCAEDILEDAGLRVCTAWINELEGDDY